MAKTFGIVAADGTSFTAAGTIRSITKNTSATVMHSTGNDGEPDANNSGVAQPSTVTAELEVDGTALAAKDTVTIDTDTYIVTNASQVWNNDGGPSTQTVELVKSY